VFAYGQTSSGKTHTMRGTPEEPGITLLAVRDVFGHIASTQEREFLLRVSYMEARAAYLHIGGHQLYYHNCPMQRRRPALGAAELLAWLAAAPGSWR
jgi:hypothetical protein